jgi:ubiquinone/menaquinone biosynthesis C-methylase UbiE
MSISYDTLAADYAIHRSVQPNLFRRLAEFCRSESPSKVLEVGCGTGNYAAALAVMTPAQCSGLDPSARMLAAARQKATFVSWHQGSAESLPYPEGRFDFVYSVDVVHHVQDRRAFFSEAFRVLANGGWFATGTDSEEIIRTRVPLSRYFPETIEPELQRYPKQGEIPGLLSASGFQEHSEEVIEFAYALSDSSAFERKAFSSLHLIPEEAFTRGLTRLKQDLQAGPLACVSRYVLHVARKPSGTRPSST